MTPYDIASLPEDDPFRKAVERAASLKPGTPEFGEAVRTAAEIAGDDSLEGRSAIVFLVRQIWDMRR